MKAALRNWSCLAAFVLVPSVSSSARADNKAQLAQSLFDEAKRLMAENDFAHACPKLAESQRLDPSGGTMLHLGICHASQGKTASAYAELNEAVSLARRDNRADREKVARAHLASIAPKLVRLRVDVAAEARIAGLVVTWNGTPVPEAQWGVPFPVDPGDQVVAASAPGRRQWTTRLSASTEGQNEVVAIPTLPVEVETSAPAAFSAPTAPQAPPTAPPPAEVSSSGSTQRTLGLVIGAAGVVGLGVGGYFQLSALSLANERDDAARAGDAATTAQKHDSAKSAQTGALVAGAMGVVGLGVGITLFVTAPKASSSSASLPSSSSRSAFVLSPMLDARGFVLRGPLSW